MGIIRLVTRATFFLVLTGGGWATAQTPDSRSADPRPAEPAADSARPVLGAGHIRASAYAPLKAGMRIAVEPPDLSEFSQNLSDEISRSLGENGFTVDAQADTVLSFRADDVFVEERELRPVELEGQVSNNDLIMRDKVQLTFRMPLVEDGERPDSFFTYHLQLTVNDRGGKRIWFGEAQAVAEKGKGVSTALALVPILVESLGEERKSRKFQL